MNISQNEEMDLLTKSYQNGDIGQAEYRNRRRVILESIAKESEPKTVHTNQVSGKVLKHVFLGTLGMICLVGATIAVVKYFG